MQNLAVVPVLNKVDMEAAQPDAVAEQMHQVKISAGAISPAPLVRAAPFFNLHATSLSMGRQSRLVVWGMCVLPARCMHRSGPASSV